MNGKENPPPIKSEAVKIFDARDLGRSLREVAVEVLNKEAENIESHWYHSNKDTDLFVWKDAKKNIIKQQLTFYGQLVEWNILEGVRTGLVVEDDASLKMGSSPIIRYDDEPQLHGVEQGIDIISHITSISELDRYRIINNFSKSPQLSHMAPKEIIEKYGLYNNRAKKENWLWRILKSLGLLDK